MTKKQREQFNQMLAALRAISKGYQTPDQLRKSCKNEYGLSYTETLEMSYENLQLTAANAVRNVKAIAIEN